MRDAPPFIASLAAALAGDQLRERLLLAPSHRVGRQWLDQAARRLGGLANVRVVTMRRLIRDLAEPVLRGRGLRPPSREEKIRLVGQALARVAAERGSEGYFTRLSPSLELAETLLAALEELESAMVRGAAPFRSAIAPPEKAEELIELARAYRAARSREGLAGSDELHLAAAEAAAGPGFAPPLLLVPASLARDFNALEWGFLSRWPGQSRLELPDDGGEIAAEREFFAADCLANEAREVFRRIQAAAVPLDAVEVVCLDPEAYVPALCAAGLEAFGGAVEELPLTASGGLPARHARPARLLTAWLEWLEDDLPPEGLARMLDAGLLGEGWRGEAPGVPAFALAARLRALPLEGGAGEYRRRLGRRRAGEGGAGALAGAEAWLARLVPEILPLANGGESLDLSDARAVLEAAGRLLALSRANDGKLDAYARTALAEAIERWIPHCGWPGFDAAEWLAALAAGLKVMGLGPLPGRLHVGDLWSGGQSGRPWTFVMGLDDSRFPGPVRQDPVLLDKERPALSPHLRASGHRRRLREAALAGLLARARGRLVLSYARRDAASGREQFPAGVFARLLQERGAGGPGSAALVPERPEKCLNRRDDWLAVLQARRRNSLSPASLAPWFPGLAQGEAARTARLATAFGEYDGRVPEAGAEFLAAGRALSPSALERLAACPLEFFFSRVLGVKPPDRYEPLPGRWLDFNVQGNLLHEVFEKFLARLAGDGLAVKRDNVTERANLLEATLTEAIARYRRLYPPRDVLAFRREERELREACGIFLESEVRRQAGARPLHLEIRLGEGADGGEGFSRPGPVALTLPSGRILPLRGRIDRVDRLDGNAGLAIIDYKSGKSDKYSPADPFRQGRNLQPFLYARMLEQALAEAGRPERVRGFSYFFPMPRDEGRIISYDREDLERGGMEVVEVLAGLLAAGCFPFTTEAGDVRNSDFLALFGDADALAEAAARKAESDPALAAWAALRGGAGEEGEEA